MQTFRLLRSSQGTIFRQQLASSYYSFGDGCGVPGRRAGPWARVAAPSSMSRRLQSSVSEVFPADYNRDSCVMLYRKLEGRSPGVAIPAGAVVTYKGQLTQVVHRFRDNIQ